MIVRVQLTHLASTGSWLWRPPRPWPRRSSWGRRPDQRARWRGWLWSRGSCAPCFLQQQAHRGQLLAACCCWAAEPPPLGTHTASMPGSNPLTHATPCRGCSAFVIAYFSCTCVCVCVRACVRACVRVCVHVCAFLASCCHKPIKMDFLHTQKVFCVFPLLFFFVFFLGGGGESGGHHLQELERFFAFFLVSKIKSGINGCQVRQELQGKELVYILLPAWTSDTVVTSRSGQ